MQDQEIKCQGVDRDTPCPYGATFIHTVKDQEFYQRQGFEAPKRCRDCREAKKAKKASQGGETHGHEAHSERRGYRGYRRERSDRDLIGDESQQW